MKQKIHANGTFEESLDKNYCRWSHGWGKLECQCGLDFGHTGECKCYDQTCNVTWRRPTL